MAIDVAGIVAQVLPALQDAARLATGFGRAYRWVPNNGGPVSTVLGFTDDEAALALSGAYDQSVRRVYFEPAQFGGIVPAKFDRLVLLVPADGADEVAHTVIAVDIIAPADIPILFQIDIVGEGPPE